MAGRWWGGSEPPSAAETPGSFRQRYLISRGGKALLQMLGVFAEFERSIIQERIAAGIARARAKGTRSGKAFGQPKKLSAEREAAVRAAPAAGAGIRRTARLVGTGNATWRGSQRRCGEVNHFRFDPLKRWIKLWETLTPHGEILAVLNSFVTA
jgi:hypothetical protein